MPKNLITTTIKTRITSTVGLLTLTIISLLSLSFAAFFAVGFFNRHEPTITYEYSETLGKANVVRAGDNIVIQGKNFYGFDKKAEVWFSRKIDDKKGWNNNYNQKIVPVSQTNDPLTIRVTTPELAGQTQASIRVVHKVLKSGFYYVTWEPQSQQSQLQLGDINQDGQINQQDIDLIEKFLKHTQEPTQVEKDAADLNSNRRIDRSDWLALKQLDLRRIEQTDLPLILGDVNLDNLVDVGDMLIAMKILSGKIEPTETQKQLTDLNANKRIDQHDINLLSNVIVGVITQTDLPIELGDMNDDDFITYQDAIALQHLIIAGEPTKKDLLYGDLNLDDEIDLSDIMILTPMVGHFIIDDECLAPPFPIDSTPPVAIIQAPSSVLEWDYGKSKWNTVKLDGSASSDNITLPENLLYKWEKDKEVVWAEDYSGEFEKGRQFISFKAPNVGPSRNNYRFALFVRDEYNNEGETKIMIDVQPYFGDVNFDGVVDNADADMVIKMVLRVIPIPMPEEDTELFDRAEVDGSYEITLGDAEYIARYVLKMPGYEVFPVEKYGRHHIVAVTDLSIKINGDYIDLSWSAAPQPPGPGYNYNIYRSTDAYFEPKTEDIIGTVSGINAITFTDKNLKGADVVGDINNNYFYAVKAVDLQGNTSEISNRVGEYDIELKTAGPNKTDWNVIAIPVGGEDITKASELMAAVPYCNSVAYWDADLQGYVQYDPEIPNRGDFPVIPGYPYYVNITQDSIWTVAGALTAPEFSLKPGWNVITLALNKVNITKASELQAAIGCQDVAYWDVDSQVYVKYVVPGDNDFPVRVGRAYRVKKGEPPPPDPNKDQTACLLSADQTPNDEGIGFGQLFADSSTFGIPYCCGNDVQENYLVERYYNPPFPSPDTKIEQGADGSSYACCKEEWPQAGIPDKCVFNRKCYDNNRVAETGWENDKRIYCISAKRPGGYTWYDCDYAASIDSPVPAEQSGCDLYCGGHSAYGGEASLFGEYDPGTELDCCGDDDRENYIDSSSSGGGKACCNSSTDCVSTEGNGTCYASGEKWNQLKCSNGVWETVGDVGEPPDAQSPRLKFRAIDELGNILITALTDQEETLTVRHGSKIRFQGRVVDCEDNTDPAKLENNFGGTFVKKGPWTWEACDDAVYHWIVDNTITINSPVTNWIKAQDKAGNASQAIIVVKEE